MLYQSGGISYSQWQEVTQTGNNNPSKFVENFSCNQNYFLQLKEFLQERKNPNPDPHITCNFLSQDKQHEIDRIQNWTDNSILQEVPDFLGWIRLPVLVLRQQMLWRSLFVENTWPPCARTSTVCPHFQQLLFSFSENFQCLFFVTQLTNKSLQ